MIESELLGKSHSSIEEIERLRTLLNHYINEGKSLEECVVISQMLDIAILEYYLNIQER